jgi:hypothetical protein
MLSHRRFRQVGGWRRYVSVIVISRRLQTIYNLCIRCSFEVETAA